MTVNNSSELDLNAERIESLKTGIVAAVALVITFAGISCLNQIFFAKQNSSLTGLLIAGVNFNLLISIAVVFVSGFVFGITYRYIIREDKNSHLQEGAVLAFGLVRGLAQIDTSLKFKTNIWESNFLETSLLPLVVVGGESLLLFAVGRFALDFAMYCRWLKPFRG